MHDRSGILKNFSIEGRRLNDTSITAAGRAVKERRIHDFKGLTRGGRLRLMPFPTPPAALSPPRSENKLGSQTLSAMLVGERRSFHSAEVCLDSRRLPWQAPPNEGSGNRYFAP